MDYLSMLSEKYIASIKMMTHPESSSGHVRCEEATAVPTESEERMNLKYQSLENLCAQGYRMISWLIPLYQDLLFCKGHPGRSQVKCSQLS